MPVCWYEGTANALSIERYQRKGLEKTGQRQLLMDAQHEAGSLPAVWWWLPAHQLQSLPARVCVWVLLLSGSKILGGRNEHSGPQCLRAGDVKVIG